jgi:hypothetical protein
MKMNKKYVFLSLIMLLLSACQESPTQDRSSDEGKQDTISGDNPTMAYKEVKQFKLNAETPYAIDVHHHKIYVAFDKQIVILDSNGTQVADKLVTEGEVQSIIVSNDQSIFVLHRNFFVKLDLQGNPSYKSDEGNEKSVFTSIAYADEYIFVADAGNRKVLRYNQQGDLVGEIMGVFNSNNDRKGFIVPSPYFDIAVNTDNELWVVNPGLHAIQHYSSEGSLINFWENAGNNLSGFQGCCNPAHMTTMEDGRFVTAEKGHVRIKIYSREGDLVQVVAMPESFTGNQAPDIAVDGNVIYALDYDQKIVRIYKLKENE